MTTNDEDGGGGRLREAYEAVAEVVDEIASATAALETRPDAEDARHGLDVAVTKAAAVLTVRGETLLAALMVAGRVERETNAMGLSAIEHAKRSRRGSLH